MTFSKCKSKQKEEDEDEVVETNNNKYLRIHTHILFWFHQKIVKRRFLQALLNQKN